MPPEAAEELPLCEAPLDFLDRLLFGTLERPRGDLRAEVFFFPDDLRVLFVFFLELFEDLRAISFDRNISKISYLSA
jgi:hypothetical protein